MTRRPSDHATKRTRDQKTTRPKDQKTTLTYQRILPRLRQRFSDAPEDAWLLFERRLQRHFEPLFSALFHLYGSQYDFFYHVESILETAARMWLQRPADLKTLDVERESDPLWYQSHEAIGGVCYVDLFAGDLAGVRERLPYFKELGLTYLHLMPLFASPDQENDGGYAVSSYRQVDPSLGTMAELAELAAILREHGISLVLDFVFNHTSDEHIWARQALEGDPVYEDFYFIYPDRTMPDAYDAYLREIFPDVRPGNFTYRPDIERWVWTTFNSFQWDLNYHNPEVFRHMAEEMLFLANTGVEILRLDAVPFIWKQLGTNCENLPEAHILIQAYNALVRIVAPALLFKSEAIVHPEEVAKYIATNECTLSYNPLLMALLWESLATRQTTLLVYSMRERFQIDGGCAWVNYVRCHDDIGWTFDDGDAFVLGIDGYGHRQFLNVFYSGRFEGSFARGLPFQEDPKTGDARISGTGASLAGLEKALREETEAEMELAIRRILLVHSIILSIGGIPLLYLGDEIGTLNDYSYRQDPAKSEDSRWVHRPATNWDKMTLRHDRQRPEGQIYGRLRQLISIRKRYAMFSANDMAVVDVENEHVFGFVRWNEAGRVLILSNFSERAQALSANLVRSYGLAYDFRDLVTGEDIELAADLVLEPYQFLWLVHDEG